MPDTVTDAPVSHCKGCHLKITKLGDIWTGPDGGINCAGVLEGAYNDHQPVPVSAVKDMIIRWGDVQEGDLVLMGEGLSVATEVRTFEDVWQGHRWMRTDVSWQDDEGHRHTTDKHADRLTAVRRYVTEDAG
jgi:hypothetical protein